MLIDLKERGRGTGSLALGLMEKQARQIGISKILLEVLVDNSRARQFWETSGYRMVGTLQQHHEYAGTRHDIVIFEKLLDCGVD